jgi:hypothetical protein
MKCGCKIDRRSESYKIEFCSLHAAAGPLLRALKMMADAADSNLSPTGTSSAARLRIARATITLAEAGQ